MKTSITPAVAVMACNFLMRDMNRSAPDWDGFSAEAEKELERMENLPDEEALLVADRLTERSNSLHAQQEAHDLRLAPIQAFEAAAQAARRAGANEIEIPEDIALEILPYADGIDGIVMEDLERDPKLFIDALVAGGACHDLMERLGVRPVSRVSI